MNRSTGTTGKSPGSAVRLFGVLLGPASVGLGVAGVVGGPGVGPHVSSGVGLLVSSVALVVFGAVIFIDTVLGSPLKRRFQGFRPLVFTVGIFVQGFFRGRVGGSILIISISIVLLTVGAAAGIIEGFLGSPAEGRFRSIRLPGLPGKTPWRAAGRGAAPSADAEMVVRAGWRAMRTAAWLMPPEAGRRWLAEAENFLAETTPALRRRAVASYLAGAPKVFTISWAAALARRIRLAWRGPTPR
jgi:hypothetical protein